RRRGSAACSRATRALPLPSVRQEIVRFANVSRSAHPTIGSRRRRELGAPEVDGGFEVLTDPCPVGYHATGCGLTFGRMRLLKRNALHEHAIRVSVATIWAPRARRLASSITKRLGRQASRKGRSVNG